MQRSTAKTSIAVVSTNRPLAERMSPIDEPRRTIVRHEAKHTTMSPNTVSVQLFGSTKYKRQVDEKKENYICPQPDRHTQHRNEIRCGLVSRNIVRNTSANVLKAPHCKDDTT
ncbi:hypothetical protein BLNAU_8132 [Blattamonas nauphoetae]|uniref:Uncharacterized protein n=1 Tax=Blattamonas nauphoetae TaxID=2049346 RepID=A0ABQ9XZE5_9EUKA|nr:hypothetical protein BLNAU_8132 [Blattamonas nauphoetae]